ncbi:hypothetical protein [Colwellia sp. MT41]|uniref:hypothetical protein n=1 Tax=Colwellia sp. MT41 TaxID=58049 RepID=UPI000A7C5D9F|nr:hypothetical protein [Colwellia sp. MT41]
MKTTVLLLSTIFLLTLSFSSSASECNISPNLLSAYYDVSQQGRRNTPMQAAAQKKTFELHRQKNQVLQRDISQGINDIWSLNANRLSLSRAFEQYQHAIEYQANELRYQPQWRNIFQLVVTPKLKEMQLVEQKKSGCQLEQHYVLKSKHTEYQLVWLPKLQLIKFFQAKSSTLTHQWKLTNYHADSAQITALFKQYSSYQSTDYADVGDNQSIPFLAAMINQGFSASQDTQNRHKHQHTH